MLDTARAAKSPQLMRGPLGGSSNQRIPVQLADLPQFTVLRVLLTRGSWVLTGRFDHLNGVQEGRSWLYVSRTGSLIGDLSDLDRETHTAQFDTYEPARPAVAEEGRVFPWFDGTWHDAAQVAVVLDPTHVWRSVRFEAADALARQEGGWRQLRSATDAQPETDETLVPSGWDHEHCWFCNREIRAGDGAYTDAETNWACGDCYDSYVRRQDLGFLFAAT
jgi:hypothetical protein